VIVGSGVIKADFTHLEKTPQLMLHENKYRRNLALNEA
jgi:hypothetical protein